MLGPAGRAFRRASPTIHSTTPPMRATTAAHRLAAAPLHKSPITNLKWIVGLNGCGVSLFNEFRWNPADPARNATDWQAIRSKPRRKRRFLAGFGRFLSGFERLGGGFGGFWRESQRVPPASRRRTSIPGRRMPDSGYLTPSASRNAAGPKPKIRRADIDMAPQQGGARLPLVGLSASATAAG